MGKAQALAHPRQSPRATLAQQGPSREGQVQAGTRWVSMFAKNLVPLYGQGLLSWERDKNLQRAVT